MRGTNPIRPPEKGDGSLLQVVDIFPTLQGEGPFAGQPALFIRLSGCNLACEFCDTEFELFQPTMLEDILQRVREYPHSLIVITGGEPLRQNIAPLCEALVGMGKQVQVETNGTLFRLLPEQVHIVCSPKTTATGYAPLADEMLERADALKYIVSTTLPGYQHVPPVQHANIFVQPMDEGDAVKNAANVKLACTLAQAHGYRLSLQLHKLLGIP